MTYYDAWVDSLLGWKDFLSRYDISPAEFGNVFNEKKYRYDRETFNEVIQLLINKKKFKEDFSNLLSHP